MEQIAFEQFTRRLAPGDLCAGSVFGALSLDAVLFLLDRGRVWDVRAGDVLFSYGESVASFFVVCLGSLDFFKQKDGRRLHTRTVGFGQEVGFVSMIALHDREGTVIAAQDSLVLEISSALFRELHETYPMDFGLMTLNLARDMARVIRHLSDLLVENAIKY